jgi:hypothetical protein
MTMLQVVGFGLCADAQRIYAGTNDVLTCSECIRFVEVGGSDLRNRALVDCFYLMVDQSSETWQRFSDLPVRMPLQQRIEGNISFRHLPVVPVSAFTMVSCIASEVGEYWQRCQSFLFDSYRFGSDWESINRTW